MAKVKQPILLTFLIASFLLNFALVFWVFNRQLPYTRSLEEKAGRLEKATKTETEEELKSRALSDCSKDFRERINEDLLRGLKSIAELEELREFFVKMCMQEKRFDYDR